MADLTAQRTLVKSPPELWSELSEVESLAKHLGELGDIRITRVEPESTVAWEGEDVCGTVELEQSGWGTKVTFKATVPEPDLAVVAEPVTAEAIGAEPLGAEAQPPVDGPEAAIEPIVDEPEPQSAATATLVDSVDSEPKRTGFFARWLFRQRGPAPQPAVIEPEPAVEAPEGSPASVAIQREAAPEPVAIEPPSAPEALARPDSAADPTAVDADRVQQVLDGTLEALGRAHHRPFSRG
ncbi:MAG TPA: hypothetical protein VNO82_09545 [Solirubrobacteraceae bacterium]|nr:hypothetical protein [Solirubrobacteraceae bacterium]